MPKFKRILVPVDFSPCSRAALEYAVTLAEHWRLSAATVGARVKLAAAEAFTVLNLD